MQAEVELKIGARCEAYPLSPDVRSIVLVGDVAFDRKKGRLTFTASNAEGSEGPQGPQGEPGQAGAQGEPGAQGQQGVKGDKGDKGDPGDDGADGAQGQAGADGALGADGAQGPQGEQGPAGADGAQGEQGAPGVDGDDGAPGAQGPAGTASLLAVPLVADAAGLALTNMALALGFLGGSHRFATKVDLTNFTQVRLLVNKQGTAGAAASKIILRYLTAFNTTASNWLDIGASEVSCAINVQNTVVASSWINIATLAKADVFICPLMSGGDGALDPAIGNVVAQFK